jgi:hypothetical protein
MMQRTVHAMLCVISISVLVHHSLVQLASGRLLMFWYSVALQRHIYHTEVYFVILCQNMAAVIDFAISTVGAAAAVVPAVISAGATVQPRWRCCRTETPAFVLRR